MVVKSQMIFDRGAGALLVAPDMVRRLPQMEPRGRPARLRGCTAPRRPVAMATCNVLTLSPAEVRRGGGLAVPERQVYLAAQLDRAGITVVGMQECRLPACQGGGVQPFRCI